MEPDFPALRRNMVDCQLRTYDVTDRAVLAAMGNVPREMFVPPARRPVAYIDQPVALDDVGGQGRAMLAPMTCGRMLQTLDVQAGQSFFDYACGSGYTAALASSLGAQVTAHDPSPALVTMARSTLLSARMPDIAVVDSMPDQHFDLIFVNGSCASLPVELSALMADGGKLVVVEGFGRAGRVMLYRRTGNVVGGRPVFDAAAAELAEFRQLQAFVL